MATAAAIVPSTFEQAAEALASATAGGRSVRIVGAGTKLGWGNPVQADVRLETTGLGELVEHNAGDLTATLQAGTPLAAVQRTFASAGQMLALDPPVLSEPGPTVGGVVATGDCGPLSHRYGGPRDLVVGVTVALGDGAIAHAGGKVIKNVAGYDLAKLFCGSFGTLGLILAVNVRLHPRPERTATAVGRTRDAATLAAAAIALASAPGEFESFDFAWRDGAGELLARCAGSKASPRAGRAAQLMAGAGLSPVEVAEPDEPLWERQRAGQRSRERAVIRVAARRTSLPAVIAAAADCDGALVGRAALGTSYIEVDPDRISRLRQALAPSVTAAVVLDGHAAGNGADDAWGQRSPGMTEPALELMRRVKSRFDPSGTCNPGLFVGGI